MQLCQTSKHDQLWCSCRFNINLLIHYCVTMKPMYISFSLVIHHLHIVIEPCCRFSTKPSPNLCCLLFCCLDVSEQTPVIFKSKYGSFHSGKCSWKCNVCKMSAILFRNQYIRYEDNCISKTVFKLKLIIIKQKQITSIHLIWNDQKRCFEFSKSEFWHFAYGQYHEDVDGQLNLKCRFVYESNDTLVSTSTLKNITYYSTLASSIGCNIL